jgi:GTP cyclohydrolase I
MLPFFGKIDIGYLPDDKIIGLSKIPRITKVFSRRLQVQERLTEDIGEAIFDNTKALGAGVVIKAQHMCSSMRGVNLPETEMITSSLFGSFKTDNATRKEFFDLIK